MEEVKQKKGSKRRSCKDCPQCNGSFKYSCFWVIENEMPEKFKPSEIKAYVSVENINGIGYLKATEIDKDFDSEFLSWFLAFCVGKNINAFWRTKGLPFCIGSQVFVETALTASNLDMI